MPSPPPGAPRVAVILPALNEEAAIGSVLAAIPRDWVKEMIVVDNGSTDGTADAARAGGARVVSEPRRGYGRACLAGIAAAANAAGGAAEIVVFLDADASDSPGELPRLVRPIMEGRADLVIGARVAALRERGAMPPQAAFGNWLAGRLIGLFWGAPCSDLGPFRAISARALAELAMSDPTYGWTVEMQIKALRHGMMVMEIAVPYRPRVGQSKISGTLKGTVLAGWKIVTTILRHGLGGG